MQAELMFQHAYMQQAQLVWCSRAVLPLIQALRLSSAL
jgi:hypothetical protein